MRLTLEYIFNLYSNSIKKGKWSRLVYASGSASPILDLFFWTTLICDRDSPGPNFEAFFCRVPLGPLKMSPRCGIGTCKSYNLENRDICRLLVNSHNLSSDAFFNLRELINQLKWLLDLVKRPADDKLPASCLCYIQQVCNVTINV